MTIVKILEFSIEMKTNEVYEFESNLDENLSIEPETTLGITS